MRNFLAIGVANLIFFTFADGQEKKDSPEPTWGKLRGQITLAPGKIPANNDGTWIVDRKTKGVANVFVYLKEDPKDPFPIPADAKKSNRTVRIKILPTGYVPRAAAIFPSFKEGDKIVETGEKLKFLNSTDMNEVVRVIGDPLKNPLNVVGVQSGFEAEAKFMPQRLPIMLQSAINPQFSHRAKLMVFSHPYFAVTHADGSFEIPVVPAGREVTLMAWHEGVGYVLTKNGRQLTLKKGANREDAEIKAPE